MIGDFPNLVDRVWRVGAGGGNLLSLFCNLSVPLFWFGIVLYYFTERSRPRIAGLTATLSGLFALAGFAVLSYFAFLNKVTLLCGYYVWLTSMALLAAAGLCKLMGILFEYTGNRLPDQSP
jgi:hypothetical protein